MTTTTVSPRISQRALRSRVAPTGTAYVPARFGITLLQQHDTLWRVTRQDGEVLGYITQIDEPEGRRFRARRLLPRNAHFLDLGSYTLIDDAIECFRLG